MKTLFFAFALLLGSLAQADQITHLPLDLSGQEYQKLIEKSGVLNLPTEDAQTDQLKKILEIGKRNLEWVAKINSVRPEAQWILLSTKETQTGIPITAPRKYNGDTVIKDYEDNMKSVDKSISTMLLGTQPLTSTINISDVLFTEGSRKIDRSYQMASRWLLLKPYMAYLSGKRSSDIRGYYFLSRLPDTAATLRNYANLSAEEKAQVKTWLLQMCFVKVGKDATCEKNFSNSKDLTVFYATYLQANKTTYDEFFELQNKRSDVKAVNVSGVVKFTMPFLDPKNEAVWRFVKDNVEDTWRGQNWKLELNAVSSGSGLTHIVFQEGATPNVNGLGGNRITMDKNLSLKDYNNTWTISHEYGHVLGFPDCYLEFYDPSISMMTSYQIDLTNIMCSRKGGMLKTHEDEMLKAYAR